MGIKMKSDEKILGVLQAVNRAVVSQIDRYNVTRSVPHPGGVEYVISDTLKEMVVRIYHERDKGGASVYMDEHGKKTIAIMYWTKNKKIEKRIGEDVFYNLLDTVEKRCNQAQKQNNDIDNVVDMVKKLKLPTDKASEIIKLLTSQRIR